MKYLVIILYNFVICYCHSYNWSSINLPESHIAPFFQKNQDVKNECMLDDKCPFEAIIANEKCWGYERNCNIVKRIASPDCPDDSEGWAETKEEQISYFWTSADFGYVQERLKEMKILCEPKYPDDSSFNSRYARYCQAKNLYMDFRHARFTEKEPFQEDFLLENDIGGHCELNKKLLMAEYEHKGALQSWFAEIEQFSSLNFKPNSKEYCDVIIDKPVIFMKLNEGDNMFHHFCDLVNLYISLHIKNLFKTDIYLVIWETSHQDYYYFDMFGETFRAFTEHEIIRLKDFAHKRVCMKDAVFPLLSKMIRGMFHNMGLIPGCYGSSLFKAFSAHLIHRLHIVQKGPLENKIRITFLVRNTEYRKIVNHNKLVSLLKSVEEYDIREVRFEFNEMPFLEQVKMSHNSDVFIGIHGAGLTHLIFQPAWGSVIELYNCKDSNYENLARLRGVKYFTWEKTEKMTQQDTVNDPEFGENEKFANYAFDETEFMRLVAMAATYVRNHKDFIEARKLKFSSSKKVFDDEL